MLVSLDADKTYILREEMTLEWFEICEDTHHSGASYMRPIQNPFLVTSTPPLPRKKARR